MAPGSDTRCCPRHRRRRRFWAGTSQSAAAARKSSQLRHPGQLDDGLDRAPGLRGRSTGRHTPYSIPLRRGAGRRRGVLGDDLLGLTDVAHQGSVLGARIGDRNVVTAGDLDHVLEDGEWLVLTIDEVASRSICSRTMSVTSGPRLVTAQPASLVVPGDHGRDTREAHPGEVVRAGRRERAAVHRRPGTRPRASRARGADRWPTGRHRCSTAPGPLPTSSNRCRPRQGRSESARSPRSVTGRRAPGRPRRAHRR